MAAALAPSANAEERGRIDSKRILPEGFFVVSWSTRGLFICLNGAEHEVWTKDHIYFKGNG